MVIFFPSLCQSQETLHCGSSLWELDGISRNKIHVSVRPLWNCRDLEFLALKLNSTQPPETHQNHDLSDPPLSMSALGKQVLFVIVLLHTSPAFSGICPGTTDGSKKSHWPQFVQDYKDRSEDFQALYMLVLLTFFSYTYFNIYLIREHKCLPGKYLLKTHDKHSTVPSTLDDKNSFTQKILIKHLLWEWAMCWNSPDMITKKGMAPALRELTFQLQRQKKDIRTKTVTSAFKKLIGVVKQKGIVHCNKVAQQRKGMA